jgi:Na+/H+-dicarboxylate symporter
MTDLYKAAKEKFPLNVIIAMILGIIIGYFIAVYVSGGVG